MVTQFHRIGFIDMELIGMSQHFLKTSRSRDFSAWDATQMTEEEVRHLFMEARWGSHTQQICPSCGVIDSHYYRKVRRQWRCRHCDGYFSLMQGSLFQDIKLPLKKLLMAIMIYVHCANGISYHFLARVLRVQIKTAQVLVGKLRESMYYRQTHAELSGLIHMDGGYFGGRPRHGRLRRGSTKKELADYIENRLTSPVSKKKPRSRISRDNLRRRENRRVVMVLREVDAKGNSGGMRTVIAVSKSENETHAVLLAQTYIAPGSTVMTDENPAYNQLSKWFHHQSVPHAIAFSENGVSDNQAESYFSRLRRYVLGVGHRIEPKYLADIAVEMAWREDMRRKTEGEKLSLLLASIFRHGRSRWWRGYWQGYSRPGEMKME